MEEKAFWNDDLEKTVVRREMSSWALRWPRVVAIEEMERGSYSGWKREAGCGSEGKKRKDTGLALLTVLKSTPVWRERARKS